MRPLKGITYDQERNATRTPRRNSSGRITPETALRLERCFGGDAQSWMNLQTIYGRKIAKKAKAKIIMKEVEVMASDGRFALGA